MGILLEINLFVKLRIPTLIYFEICETGPGSGVVTPTGNNGGTPPRPGQNYPIYGTNNSSPTPRFGEPGNAYNPNNNGGIGNYPFNQPGQNGQSGQNGQNGQSGQNYPIYPGSSGINNNYNASNRGIPSYPGSFGRDTNPNNINNLIGHFANVNRNNSDQNYPGNQSEYLKVFEPYHELSEVNHPSV